MFENPVLLPGPDPKNRQHLAVLAEAQLIAQTGERRKVRGRPRKMYTARVDALQAFRSVSGSYQRLAELLLELATSEQQPYDVGFASAANRTKATDPAHAGKIDDDLDAIASQLLRQLATEGFEPELIKPDVISLAHRPFADVATDAPQVVCELHRGLIDGQFSTTNTGFLAELTPRPPHKAGCRIALLAVQSAN